MHRTPKISEVKRDIETFFANDLVLVASQNGWLKDRAWTDGIHKHVAEIGHRYEYQVFASKNRCSEADAPECLYDHHWRLLTGESDLVRIPLIMEVEWGFGEKTMWARIKEDFLKLVQARADLRVMVFQGRDVKTTTDRLIELAKGFEGTQPGDQYFFAGWDAATQRMQCRSWAA